MTSREAAAQDTAAHFLDLAARNCARPLSELTAEFEQLSAGPGRITAEEYLKFALYDSQKYTQREKQAFLSDKLHWPIVRRCCDMSWMAVTEDKWLAAQLLAFSGIPTPSIIAVLDKSLRIYPKTPTIGSLDQFRDFLKRWDGKPFFAKRLRGLASAGIFRCERYEGERLFVTGKGEVSLAELYSQHLSGHKYILQAVQKNHSFFDRICQNLATVRIGVMVYDDSVKLAFCFLKIPGAGTLEDRFHPEGNMACGLRPETGEILTIRRRTAHGATTHMLHPENGMPLIGLRLPWWEEVKKVVAVTARVFAPVRYQTMDIAISDKGPVLIEVNTGGGFGGPQLVTERGLLQPPFLDFLKACRIELSKL